jgi:hypothetical protein
MFSYMYDLEELLARPAKSGKDKMRLVLKFLRGTPPFDIAVVVEGMPWRKRRKL